MPKKPDELGSYLTEMQRRADAFEPKLISSDPSWQRREALKDILPQGSSFSDYQPSRKATLFGGGLPEGSSTMPGGGGSSQYHMRRPYQPELDSPDRQDFPQDRKRANAYWRMFHKYDPCFGTAMDMYAEMLTSTFDIIIQEDTSSEIRDTLQYMCDEVSFIEKLRYIVREFLVLGEVFPHLFYDDELRIWTHIGFHNPDYMEVKDLPMISMDPILNVLPDASMKAALSENTPESRELRQKLPGEFVSKVLAGQKIRLSPTNCSMLARKLHPYDVRGTSLATRLWRIWMVEDAVYNATIAIYRRHACFVAGTKVLTNEGTKNIEEMKEGDIVVSGDGQFKKVEAAWEEVADEIVELKVAGSEKTECTANHRFKVWTKPRTCACGCGQELTYEYGGTPRSFITGHHNKSIRDPITGQFLKECKDWKIYSEEPSVRVLSSYEPIQTLNAEDIKRGDFLLIPRKFNESQVEVNNETRLKARLLGYYVAEGGRVQIPRLAGMKYGVNWAFSKAEFDTWAEDVVCSGIELGLNARKRFDCKATDPIREGVTRVFVDNVKDLWFAEWCFKHGGVHSKTKVLSEEVMSWPLELKKELLIGMYRGDGHKSKSGDSVFYDSVSTSLVYQVRLILAQLGIFGSIYKQEKGIDHPNWNDCYAVCSSGKGGRTLRDMIWSEKLPEPPSGNGGSWTWMDDDYIYVQVLGVEKRKETTPVYNLTVEGDHSYIANGLATLNSPIKVLKQGDATTGYIPDPSQETRMLEMLARAELDPNAWMCVNYAVNFEAWGTTQQAISIARDHDVIERIKLVGLGLSKSFMSGEVTFASAKSGLQVFLRRLLSMRQYLESTWIYPKFFKPICQMNGWKKAKPSEVTHRYRMKRTSQEIQEENLLIVPKLVWHNKLDPNLDEDLLRALGQIKQQFGIKVRKETVCNAVGVDWEEELAGHYKEFLTEEKIKTKILGATKSQEYDTQESAGGAKPPGTPGAGALPPGAKPPKGGGPTPPGGAAKNVTMNDKVEPPGGAGGGSEMPTTIE